MIDLNSLLNMRKTSSEYFLDLSIINKDNTIILDWYYKKTFSDRYLSFYSNQHVTNPACHKIGTIYSLVDRVILLSDSTFYNKNIEFKIII